MKEEKKNTGLLKGENLTLAYPKGNQKNVVAKGISFELQKGKLTCLLGPNGVGKSTLLKVIMGQPLNIGGSLLLDKRDIRDFSPNALAKKIAVVLTDKINTGNLTVSQLVALGRIPHTGWLGKLQENDKKIVQEAIQATKTTNIQEKRLSELSDGQLQKAMIARALAQDCEILVLDEPTAHLDLINRFGIMHLLRKIAHRAQKAILVVTHDLEIAIETADNFWLMPFNAPLICGCPEDLITDGKINLLLPEEGLFFNPISGKVQLSETYSYPKIHGPAAIRSWVQLALRKNQMALDNKNIEISIQQDPLSYNIKRGNEYFLVNTIEELVQQLKN